MGQFNFGKEESNYDVTGQSFPGVFMYILDTPAKKRVLFWEAKEDAWAEMYECRLPPDRYQEFWDDWQNDELERSFRLKVLVSSPLYSNSEARRKVLKEIRQEFSNEFPEFEEYKK